MKMIDSFKLFPQFISGTIIENKWSIVDCQSIFFFRIFGDYHLYTYQFFIFEKREYVKLYMQSRSPGF